VLLCTDVAARGLDVPDVDWIVQFDAPQDPAAFVHRVGRAGRAGRKGRSLLLLDPKEDAYVEFLALRKIALRPWQAWPDLSAWWNRLEVKDDDEDDKDGGDKDDEVKDKGGKGEKAGKSGDTPSTEPTAPAAEALATKAVGLSSRLRLLAGRDRDLLEKGSRAFMAHLRAYKEHKCEFIFRLKSLDVNGLANAFGLLRMPRIPELRRGGALFGQKSGGSGGGFGSEFVADMTVSTEDVPYLDKGRERARRKRLEVAKEATAALVAAEEEAQRKQVEGGAQAGSNGTKQLSGAEKKRAKSMELALAANPHWSEDGPRKRKGKQQQMMEEWDDLAKEERLFKKLRKGTITQKQYEAELKGKKGKTDGAEENEEEGGSEGEGTGEDSEGETSDAGGMC